VAFAHSPEISPETSALRVAVSVRGLTLSFG
jgi:hypothetical protein